MNPAELDTLVQAAQTIAAVLSGLGVPGLVGLALAGPACVLMTVLVLDHKRSARMELAQERFRENVNVVLEAYRADTSSMLHEIGKEHAEVVNFYNDNVELVRGYNRMADAMQTLVVNNTRALERLVTIIETREHL
ncbi:conserved hypothetical protein [uncultured Desulfovibrio sp.]|uniref:Uncharacterized protein n=1 Tax=uncultured Desulfovibrio sp. TaxID=167968 RepID=A0A212K659_9BACT|nr:hypothetical protein [uncultured Desulfovibrio sp.]SBW07204.1 conserved hypothetical protein [uncultured Desulfovibrio sp.]